MKPAYWCIGTQLQSYKILVMALAGQLLQLRAYVSAFRYGLGNLQHAITRIEDTNFTSCAFPSSHVAEIHGTHRERHSGRLYVAAQLDLNSRGYRIIAIHVYLSAVITVKAGCVKVDTQLSLSSPGYRVFG